MRESVLVMNLPSLLRMEKEHGSHMIFLVQQLTEHWRPNPMYDTFFVCWGDRIIDDALTGFPIFLAVQTAAQECALVPLDDLLEELFFPGRGKHLALDIRSLPERLNNISSQSAESALTTGEKRLNHWTGGSITEMGSGGILHINGKETETAIQLKFICNSD